MICTDHLAPGRKEMNILMCSILIWILCLVVFLPLFPLIFPTFAMSGYWFYTVLLLFHLQSDIYFVSSAPVSSASNCSSRDTSSQSSPQTPTGYEMPVFPSPLGDGKPGTVKAPEDADIRFCRVFLFVCMRKVSKCQCCLQTSWLWMLLC